jgi:hypothetical protein
MRRRRARRFLALVHPFIHVIGGGSGSIQFVIEQVQRVFAFHCTIARLRSTASCIALRLNIIGDSSGVSSQLSGNFIHRV